MDSTLVWCVRPTAEARQTAAPVTSTVGFERRGQPQPVRTSLQMALTSPVQLRLEGVFKFRFMLDNTASDIGNRPWKPESGHLETVDIENQ